MSRLRQVGANSAVASRTRGPSVLARCPAALPIVVSGIGWAMLLATHPAVPGAGTGTGASGHGAVFTPVGIALTAAMTVAMMAPLAVSGVRTTAFTSLWWRAGRAAVTFLAAFLLSWTVIALCLAALATAWTTWLGSAATGTAVLLGMCALAQLDPTRPEKMQRCDRGMRLRANGFDADVDCARYGVLTAGRDVRFCALPMLATLAADQLPAGLPVMAAVSALVLADRVTGSRRRVLVAATYAFCAVALLLAAWTERT